ncbi:MAG: hypothetical protein M1838_006255 [Thelocarpon superellum]|nr:MAG: hypothetical protein M1838_006255 [Thelocarpon superellum]
MSKFECLASYNWLSRDEATIVVPGSPAKWAPPTPPRKLPPDAGRVFIDQNAARSPASPMAPMFLALYEQRPDLVLDEVDVVICRNSMSKLLDFVSGRVKAWEMEVEMVGDKAVFVRKEARATEMIDGFRGFGHTFPEEYTTWDRDVRGSSSHHRVARYELAGWTYLVRFECAAYLPEKLGTTRRASFRSSPNAGGDDPAVALRGAADLMTIGEQEPGTGGGLALRRCGRAIDQGATVEIKTRAAHKRLELSSVLPRLWISQIPNLIVAYHKAGRFDEVQVSEIRAELDAWEAANGVNLSKLDTLIRRIVETIGNTVAMKGRICVTPNGTLQIYALDVGHPSVLPDDLARKLREDGDVGYERGEHLRDAYDDDDDHFDRDDFGDEEGSPKDFTACSSSGCGFCGHCDYEDDDD